MGAERLATVEIGDAVEVASRYDGQFDLALLDIEKYTSHTLATIPTSRRRCSRWGMA
jgi:predicted O-methyltransferase YrrM